MVSFTGVVPGVGAASSSTSPVHVLTDVHDKDAIAWASKVFRQNATCVANPLRAPRSRTIDVTEGDLDFAGEREDRDVRALFVFSTRKIKKAKNSELFIDVYDYEFLADLTAKNCQPGCRLYVNFLCDTDALKESHEKIAEAATFAGFVNAQWGRASLTNAHGREAYACEYVCDVPDWNPPPAGLEPRDDEFGFAFGGTTKSARDRKDSGLTDASTRAESEEGQGKGGANVLFKWLKKVVGTGSSVGDESPMDDDDGDEPDDYLKALNQGRGQKDLKIAPLPTTGKAAGLESCDTQPKACANCSCGRKEREDDEEEQKKLLESGGVRSACGNCYLGDAFRCGGCPYKGLPAFQPGKDKVSSCCYIAWELSEQVSICIINKNL